MSNGFRQPDILRIARAEGRVSVDDLAARFGVTVQTIRRDLSELAQAGRLKRVHGGAVLPSGMRNIGYEDRRQLNAGAKSAIAARCAALIPDAASLFLNIGTTTEAVARALLPHRDLMAVTNNMNVAHILEANPGCEVIVTGGTLRRADGGLIGDLTIRAIRQFKFDIAVIGCSSLDAEGDIRDYDLQEVSVSRTIIEQAQRVILVADASKLHRSAPVRIASMRQVDTWVTDAPPPKDLARHCEKWRTRVVVAA